MINRIPIYNILKPPNQFPKENPANDNLFHFKINLFLKPFKQSIEFNILFKRFLLDQPLFDCASVLGIREGQFLSDSGQTSFRFRRSCHVSCSGSGNHSAKGVRREWWVASVRGVPALFRNWGCNRIDMIWVGIGWEENAWKKCAQELYVKWVLDLKCWFCGSFRLETNLDDFLFTLEEYITRVFVLYEKGNIVFPFITFGNYIYKILNGFTVNIFTLWRLYLLLQRTWSIVYKYSNK